MPIEMDRRAVLSVAMRSVRAVSVDSAVRGLRGAVPGASEAA